MEHSHELVRIASDFLSGRISPHEIRHESNNIPAKAGVALLIMLIDGWTVLGPTTPRQRLDSTVFLGDYLKELFPPIRPDGTASTGRHPSAKEAQRSTAQRVGAYLRNAGAVEEVGVRRNATLKPSSEFVALVGQYSGQRPEVVVRFLEGFPDPPRPNTPQPPLPVTASGEVENLLPSAVQQRPDLSPQAALYLAMLDTLDRSVKEEIIRELARR